MENNSSKLYIDTHMGVAGDMLVGALFELIDNQENALKHLNNLNIEGLKFVPHKVNNDTINGTLMKIINDNKNKYEKISLKDVVKIINNLALEENIRNDVLAIYYEISKAECNINNVSMKELYFYQLGRPEAIGGIAATCYLLNKLNVDEIICSPINVGKGKHKCPYGIFDVPADITKELLKGLPYYAMSNYDGELTTPTGAALIKVFANKFIDFKHIPYIKEGHGIGSRPYPTINYVSAFLVR